MIRSALTYILEQIRKALPAFMRKWRWELWSIPLMIVIFFTAAKIIRWYEPTAGTYDAGVLQEMFLAAVKVMFGCLIAWILIRAYFKEVWNYTESKEFVEDFNMLDQRWRVIITVAIFLSFLFAFVSISKGETPGTSCIVKVATTQIQVREATGNNDGLQVEKYLSSVSLAKGNPWCAAFVSWCYDQCGSPHVRSGYCPDWFKKKENIIYQRNLLRYINFQKVILSGKVFGIYFAQKNRIAHVGIIEKVEGDCLLTIEGNTNEKGSREGDGVYRKRRLISQVYSIVSPT